MNERTLVSFDWAMKNILRDKANFDILFEDIIKYGRKVGWDTLEIRNSHNLENTSNNDKSNARLFIAVYIDEVRLIDNIKL